jgi:ectoine hydroxylase-related dioxygenase (phytanoyl-CoA dioxygenase family)
MTQTEAATTFEFLSPEWFDALEAMGGAELEDDDPVANIIVPDSPYGEVQCHLGGTRFRAGHHPCPDATATVPYKRMVDIFIGGGLAVYGNHASLFGCTLGEIQIEGDYAAWAMLTASQNLNLIFMRLPLIPMTTPHPDFFKSGKARELSEIYANIDRLGLGHHLRELDEQGYTVVTPDETGVTPEMMEHAFQHVLAEVTKVEGVAPDVENGNTHRDTFYPVLWYQMFKDKVFQDMAGNEQAMALAAYLFKSQDFHLSSDDVLLKGPTNLPSEYGRQQLGLHFDTVTYGFSGAEPLPYEVLSVNCLWLITDFAEEEDGVTVFIPGTHNFRRAPQAGKEGAEHAVSITAPRGSFLIWPGTTWHGALPRTKPGLRCAMTIQYANEYVGMRNPYQLDVTEEILRANPPRFSRLLGLLDLSGWREEGVYAQLAERGRIGSQRYSDTPNTCSVPLDRAILTRKMKTRRSQEQEPADVEEKVAALAQS